MRKDTLEVMGICIKNVFSGPNVVNRIFSHCENYVTLVPPEKFFRIGQVYRRSFRVRCIVRKYWGH
ncbi:hypothetical protein DCCM_2676 [Desulfocucumis palustris]|uniref:Uncharacterized protein n=1 Tax=Desulfocucumis palustris TaxID=1898651 RepID=A0A2L2XCX6_9FIRM|nr:hypothetical protein DCCM_2676 [Desulfocucumis palustris]